jgi:glucose-1-phosphate adenylyltransferase
VEKYMRDVIAMVLAGGRVEELSVLTVERPKAAVPFGGQYRIIDFALSGLMKADFNRVGVISLYQPSSLIDHLGSGEPWDFIGRGRGVKILPPFMTEGASQWYEGTADAIYRNLNFVRDHAPRDVLILSGDHIHDLDLQAMIAQHRRTDADLTMAFKKMDPKLGLGRFGLATLGPDKQVLDYQERPDRPISKWVSLTVYLFKTDVLMQRLAENQVALGQQQLARCIPALLAKRRVFAFVHAGYWNYARSIQAYHQAHMDLLGAEPKFRLDQWPLRSRKVLHGLGDMPPIRFEIGAACENSLVCPGVRLAGRVQNSVLSPGVQIESGAKVTNSVLFHRSIVRAGARLDKVVLDKQVEVGQEAQVGAGGFVPHPQMPLALLGGFSVVGKNNQVPAGAWVGRNCAIYPEIQAGDWPDEKITSGQCLRSNGAGR